MVLDGSVWWDRVLGAFSPIPREPSSTLPWRLSISSSSKGLLIISDYIFMLGELDPFNVSKDAVQGYNDVLFHFVYNDI